MTKLKTKPKAPAKSNGVQSIVSGSYSTYSYDRPKQDENGRCNHNVVFEGVDGYVRCGYCRAIIDDMTNYR